MSVELDLSRRRVLITGAGQGVGRGLALAFGAAGAEVLINDLRGGRADAVVAEVVSAGGAAVAVPFDAHQQARFLRTDVFAIFGRCGGAGADRAQHVAPFVVDEDFGLAWNVALETGGWLVGKDIKLDPATIVSDAGRTGDANGAAYAAAKAGAAGLTRSIALENGRYGITANNIALGTMRTPLTEPLWAEMADSPQAKAILQPYAIRRPGLHEDVTALAVLLSSDHGAWITGQTIPVNGGYSFAL